VKKCTKCKVKKSSTEFGKDRKRRDGLKCWCKECCAEHQRSPVGKVVSRKSAKKYNQSALGGATRKKYQQTPVHKEAERKRSKERCATLRGYLKSRWDSIKSRCDNSNNENYCRYGGRGIRCLFTKDGFYNYVVNELGFETVASLKGKDVHRIDGDNSNYERGNIEFITKKEHGLRHRELNQKYNRSVA